LLAHAITGFLGTLTENTFIAKSITAPTENWSVLLGLNEINWIICESSTVAYSIMKLIPILPTEQHKKILAGVMGLLFVGFSSFRIQIGVLRAGGNTLGNAGISKAHSDAFLWWGVADLIVLALLVWNTKKQVEMYSGNSIVLTLFQSSIPRIFVLVV
jgi:hypothetical protein